MSYDLCGHYESLTLIAAVFADCALTTTSQKLQLPEHFQQPDPAEVQTLRCWTPQARRKNLSQPVSLRRDEGKSKPCFLTHGGDSVLTATLFHKGSTGIVKTMMDRDCDFDQNCRNLMPCLY